MHNFSKGALLYLVSALGIFFYTQRIESHMLLSVK